MCFDLFFAREEEKRTRTWSFQLRNMIAFSFEVSEVEAGFGGHLE